MGFEGPTTIRNLHGIRDLELNIWVLEPIAINRKTFTVLVEVLGGLVRN